MSLTYITVSALFAVTLTPLLLRIAAWRTLRQPLLCYPEHEKSILASVCANPSYAALVLDLEPEHFVDSARALLWSEIKHYCLTLVTHNDNSTHELVLANKNTLSKVEPKLLLAALSTESALVLRKGLLVTWNGSGFDMPFLHKRYVATGVSTGLRVLVDPSIPSKYPTNQGLGPPVRVSWHSAAHVDI